MSTVATALLSGLRQYRRTPVLLALLVVLPAYAVGVFARIAPAGTVALHLPGDETVRAGLPETLAVLMTPMAAALVGGVAGLFLLQSTAGADARLVIAGVRPHALVLARLGQLAVVGAVVTVVAVGVALTSVAPEHLGWFAAATVLGALTYGALGAVAGLVVDRLAGVYLVLFGSLVDLFLFQNPLATDAPDAAALLPGHYVVGPASDAAFGASVDAGLFGVGVAYLGVLTAVAAGAFYRATRA